MADTLDVLSLTEARTAVGAADSGNDTAIQLYLTATSRTIDGICGPVVKRTITTERHETVLGQPWVLLTQWPIDSITAVVEYASDATATTLTADTNTVNNATGYYWNSTDKSSRKLYRRTAGAASSFPAGGHVLVTYVAGRYADTASVDPAIKLGALITFQNLWRFSRGTGNQTFGAPEGTPGYGVPNAAMAVLADYLLPPTVG